MLLLVAILLGMRWQRQSAALIGTNPERAWAVLVIPIMGALVFLALVALARTVRTAYHKLVARLQRYMGRRAARATGLILLTGFLVLAITGVAWSWALDTLDTSLAVGDLTTPRGIEKPTTDLRSGGPGSLISWNSLGREGRIFVGEGPNAQDISKLTGAPAQEPIRIFAGTGSADGTEAGARLADDDLKRAGGFDRGSLLVVTTTGSGWVEPSAVSSFEYLTGGDSAIVAMQYSHLPSWLAYLSDHTRAGSAGRDLFDAVYEQWSRLPPTSGPGSTSSGRAWGPSAPRTPSAVSSTWPVAPTVRCSCDRPASTPFTAASSTRAIRPAAKSSPSTGTDGSSGSPTVRASPFHPRNGPGTAPG